MEEEIEDSTPMDLLFWLLRLRRRFRVSGASMLPLLRPGDEVLVNARAYRRRPPQLGDIVVARHPYQDGMHIIKRVTALQGDDQYLLEGDNPSESTDSRSFGAIPGDLILGRVTCRFP
jgi:nickel-type superoxide dismutase maturation protease